MAVWRGARQAREGVRKELSFCGVGGRRDRRQSSGEPRPGILDLGVSGRRHPTPYSSLALTNTKHQQKRTLPHWRPLKPFLTSSFSPEAQTLSPRVVSSPVTSHMSFQTVPAAVHPSPISHRPRHLFLGTADLIPQPVLRSLCTPCLLPCACPVPSMPLSLSSGS